VEHALTHNRRFSKGISNLIISLGGDYGNARVTILMRVMLIYPEAIGTIGKSELKTKGSIL